MVKQASKSHKQADKTLVSGSHHQAGHTKEATTKSKSSKKLAAPHIADLGKKQHQEASPDDDATTNETDGGQSSPTSSKRLAMHAGDALFSMRTFNAEIDLPLVYNDLYNIRMMGLELTHRCDTKRFEKLAEELNSLFMDTPHARHRLNNEHTASREEDIRDTRRLRFLSPNRPVNLQELKLHHTSDYVQQLHEDKRLLARISETWYVNLVPMCVLETRLLTPIKLQTAGTIFAAHLAMQHGWSINLGGGFHAAFADYGETFCFISDVLLAMKYVWRRHPLQKFMIIDLDAHQATGIERDLVDLPPKRRQMVFMVDVFNNTIQPPDAKADKAVNLRLELPRFVGDETYLKQLDTALTSAFATFKPSLVFYIAGQDILQSDQLGLMNISDGGLIKRDELVFSHATERNKCPIVMLLGGGYLARSVRVQASSIKNLFAKNLIWAGHRSGARTLTRPRYVKLDQTHKTTTQSLSQPTADNEPTTAITKTLPFNAKHLEVPDSFRYSVAPEVDAISQSVSTSGGARRTQIVRLLKTTEKSHGSASKKGLLLMEQSVQSKKSVQSRKSLAPPPQPADNKQSSKSSTKKTLPAHPPPATDQPQQQHKSEKKT